MKLGNLQIDAVTMKAGAMAFISLAESGAGYEAVYHELRNAGVHGNATHAFIERLEKATGRKLPGKRPARMTSAERTAKERESITQMIEADRARRGLVYRLMPGRSASTGTKVLPCPKCGAPVVDSDRARAGHTMRTGCEGYSSKDI